MRAVGTGPGPPRPAKQGPAPWGCTRPHRGARRRLTALLLLPPLLARRPGAACSSRSIALLKVAPAGRPSGQLQRASAADGPTTKPPQHGADAQTPRQMCKRLAMQPASTKVRHVAGARPCRPAASCACHFPSELNMLERWHASWHAASAAGAAASAASVRAAACWCCCCCWCCWSWSCCCSPLGRIPESERLMPLGHLVAQPH